MKKTFSLLLSLTYIFALGIDHVNAQTIPSGCTNPTDLSQCTIDVQFNSLSVGTTTTDGDLKLDVEGKIGATHYCDESGDNCFEPGDINTDTPTNSTLGYANTTYDQGDIVSYQNQLFQANAIINEAEFTTYNASTSYQTGDEVYHQNIIYVANQAINDGNTSGGYPYDAASEMGGNGNNAYVDYTFYLDASSSYGQITPGVTVNSFKIRTSTSAQTITFKVLNNGSVTNISTTYGSDLGSSWHTYNLETPYTTTSGDEIGLNAPSGLFMHLTNSSGASAGYNVKFKDWVGNHDIPDSVGQNRRMAFEILTTGSENIFDENQWSIKSSISSNWDVFQGGNSSIPLWKPSDQAGIYVANDMVNYNGNLYKNLTGTNTNTAPDTDTTNWQIKEGSSYNPGSAITISSETISHADTSSQNSVDNTNGNVIQDVTLDTYGHLTGLSSTNLDGRYYTEAESDSRFLSTSSSYNINNVWMRENGDNAHFKIFGNSRQMAFRTDGTSQYASGVGNYPFVWMYQGDTSSNRLLILDTAGQIWSKTYGWLHSYFTPSSRTISAGSGLSGGGNLTSNRTISHADTSSQGSVNNSGSTFIQDISLDTYGHITSISSATASSSGSSYRTTKTLSGSTEYSLVYLPSYPQVKVMVNPYNSSFTPGMEVLNIYYYGSTSAAYYQQRGYQSGTGWLSSSYTNVAHYNTDLKVVNGWLYIKNTDSRISPRVTVWY